MVNDVNKIPTLPTSMRMLKNLKIRMSVTNTSKVGEEGIWFGEFCSDEWGYSLMTKTQLQTGL